MATIWLAQIAGWNPDTELEEVLYFSSSNYTTGTSELPPDGFAHTYYEPRIKQPAILQRNLYTSRKTYGISTVSYGLLELINNDGELDYLSSWGFDGRSISIIFGEVLQESAPTWTKVLTGTMEQIELTWEKVSFRIYDKQKLFTKKILLTEYAGNNALPSGLEGVEGDLKGKQKPRLFGTVYQITPVLVNTAKLIYQVNDGAIESILGVYDSGAALSAGAVYTSEADMFANDPTAGEYRVWPAGGYFRIGISPTNTLTCDARQGATAGDRTVAQIIKAICLSDSLLTSGEIDSVDVSAADTANNSEVGIWINSQTTYQAVFDELANSIRLWYSFNSLGILQMGVLSFPFPTASFIILKADIISLTKTSSNNDGNGIPCKKVTLNYKKYYTTQTSSLAGSVTDAVKNELSKEYRTITKENVAILTKHPLAVDLEFDTLLVDPTDADTAASDLLDIYETDTAFYELRCVLDASFVPYLDFGNTVNIQYERLGITEDKNLLITGIKPNTMMNLLDLTLWG